MTKFQKIVAISFVVLLAALILLTILDEKNIIDRRWDWFIFTLAILFMIDILVFIVLIVSGKRFYNFSIWMILLSLIGIFFKIIHYKGSDALIVLSFGFFVIGLVVLAFRVLLVFRKNFYIQVTGFFACLITAMALVGFAFKMNYYRYADIIVLTSSVLFIIYILGLMSGTSCDGLDMARIRITHTGQKTEFELLNSKTIPYSAEQKKYLLHLIQSETTSAQELSKLNFYLSKIWSEMIQAFLKENNLTAKDVDLIGSHGQTIWHEPLPGLYVDRQISSTFQLGDPSVLAQLTQIPVVGDFRTADVALGGQGAPLIPYFDWIYFSKFKQNILSVNIGGISNLTLVPANGNINEVAAFDCGPGNMLIDLAVSQLFDLPFDKGGLLAKSGKEDKKGKVSYGRGWVYYYWY